MGMEVIHRKPKVNPEDYIDAPRTPFKKGNPGRPVGCKNKDTIARDAIIDMFNKRSDELGELEFKKLIDAVVALLPKKLQGEGFASDVRVTALFGQLDSGRRDELIALLRKRQGTG